MILRVVVLLLALANVLVFVWSNGWLGDPRGGREPERLRREVRPETVRVLPARVAEPAACLEAGPFGAAQLGPAEQVLASALPAGGWSRVAIERPGRWIVYLGRFPNRDALERRIDELRAQHVDVDELTGQPEHEPGLSLGHHDNRAAAEAALERLQQRGIRGARVLALAAPATEHLLRVGRSDPALRSKLLALQSPALGAGFSACADRR